MTYSGWCAIKRNQMKQKYGDNDDNDLKTLMVKEKIQTDCVYFLDR